MEEKVLGLFSKYVLIISGKVDVIVIGILVCLYEHVMFSSSSSCPRPSLYFIFLVVSWFVSNRNMECIRGIGQ